MRFPWPSTTPRKLVPSFPIVLTESDSVKSDEVQEETDNADAAKAQAAEREQAEQQQRQFMWWWLMNRHS